ncbi:MAG: hypothetical protein Q9228_005939 [Teloschistes exilis]
MQRVLGRVVSDAQQTYHPRQRYLQSIISHQSLTGTRRVLAAGPPHLHEDRRYQTQTISRQRRNFSGTNIRRAAQQTPSTNEEDSENFWKVPAKQTDFWSAYVSTRPNYSPRFYKYIYDHHTSHSSSFQVCHDVGCGAGQASAELATRFNHVVASELNETHLVVAQERLRRDFDERKVSYRLSKGEDLAQYYSSESADLIVAAEAMVLMDERLALQSFAKLLRPGGTLAFWFYGRPTFADLKLRAKAQRLIDTIMVRNWATVIQKDSGPRRRAGFRRAAEGMSSWLDYVRLDSSTWIDVHRIKWNTYGTLPFFEEEACGFPIKTENRVSGGEKTETIEDPEWWRNDWDVEQLKKYFRVLFPGFKDAVGEDNKEMESIYNELRNVMGTGEAAFTWPVALVLATRK